MWRRVNHLSFDYITEGPPTFPAGLNPSLLLDQVNNVLYVWSSALTNWVLIGNSTAANDSVQNLATSQPITFLGATNAFIKATGGVSGITLTLPSATGFSGRSVKVILLDQSIGGVNIVTTASQTINGQPSYALTNQYQSVVLESDNANWFVVATSS